MEVLKIRLGEKIEELKEKSDYYNTQQLLERYDSKSIKTTEARPKENSKEHAPSENGHQRQPSENLGRDQSLDTLRLRTSSNHQLPPQIIPAGPSSGASQNDPSEFGPTSSWLPQESHSRAFLDRLLDLLVGEDENSPDHRYALICRHCRAHNGLAPPGETGEDVGYLCGRCGGWNGPDPSKKGKVSQSKGSTKQPEEGVEEGGKNGEEINVEETVEKPQE